MSKYGVKEVADITLYDLATGKPILFLDSLKVSSIENKATTVYARGGKGNPKILAWDFDREAMVKTQSALMSIKSLSLLSGTTASVGAVAIKKREVIAAVVGSAGETKVTTSKLPTGTNIAAYLSSDTTYSTPIAATFSTPDITFADTDVSVGVSVDVFYEYLSDSTSETIVISANTFPGYFKVVGDTVVRNTTTGLDEAFQFIIYKAKLSPNFTLEFKADGDPSAFDMDLEAFRDDSDRLIELIKY